MTIKRKAASRILESVHETARALQRSTKWTAFRATAMRFGFIPNWCRRAHSNSMPKEWRYGSRWIALDLTMQCKCGSIALQEDG